MDQATASSSTTDSAIETTAPPTASDANQDDYARGANSIPSMVNKAREAGEIVTFVQNCRHNNSCCWYWRFSDGSRLYHFDTMDYAVIARANHPGWRREDGTPSGPCPWCGNPKTNGGFVSAEAVQAMVTRQN